jgi:predicted AlkP superfamily phosphohydrolase/phosphomutase
VLVSTDRLQHCTWQYLEPNRPLTTAEQSIREQVLAYYTFLDGILREFIAASPGADVLLMSDHGFCHLAANVQLNTFLQQNGFLTWEKRNRTDRWRPILLLAKRLGMNRARFGKLAKAFGINEYKHLEKVSHRVNNIFWVETRAFAYTPNGVYFNLKGRESQGVVNPGAEAERLFDEIAEKLLQLRDPVTGEQVVYRVARPQEIYHGAKLHTAPDLMIAECDHRYAFNFNLYPGSSIFERSAWRTGNHDPEGILIACGPQIARNQRPGPAKLEDVAPTALHLLGEAVPEDMDGEVVSGLLANREREVAKAAAGNSSAEADGGEGMSSEEQEMIFERLRGLGYFE